MEQKHEKSLRQISSLKDQLLNYQKNETKLLQDQTVQMGKVLKALNQHEAEKLSWKNQVAKLQEKIYQAEICRSTTWRQMSKDTSSRCISNADRCQSTTQSTFDSATTLAKPKGLFLEPSPTPLGANLQRLLAKVEKLNIMVTTYACLYYFDTDSNAFFYVGTTDATTKRGYHVYRTKICQPSNGARKIATSATLAEWHS